MNKSIRTPIIPSRVEMTGQSDELDLKAICVFAAIGFFLGEDTYFNGLKALKPGHDYILDENNNVVSSTPYFNWHHTPRNITLNEATEEYKAIFEKIIKQGVDGRKVILPLSGGLDSRSLAAGLKHVNASVESYSYSFEGGLDETLYAQQIANAQQFPFHKLQVPSGYLWNKIDDLAQINGCYSEFTHPRQMAFVEKYAAYGDMFMLGHWGDVLFDNMKVEDDMPIDDQVLFLLKKIIKMGGRELGSSLWEAWGLDGKFDDYLYNRVFDLLSSFNIPNANAQLRAFKSRYWATRWTSVNLAIFDSVKPIGVPYFDNEMCELICTIPENLLGGRLIQIDYLKKYSPELARIEWQEKRPFNLYNYHKNYPWVTLPYRGVQKIKRMLQKKDFVQRNWELQFLGAENTKELKNRLFNEKHFASLVPSSLVSDYYNRFCSENSVYYAHAVSMLLTLSLFSRNSSVK